jgi:heme/copper-type cytochrome/quinol oxidase subunit 2
VIWIAGAGSLLLVVLLALGIWDLMRNRHTMGTKTVVIWALVLIFLPVLGLVWYLFWRISRAEILQQDPPPPTQPRQ